MHLEVDSFAVTLVCTAGIFCSAIGALAQSTSAQSAMPAPSLPVSADAISRVLITPNYHGNNTFNASEVFGRGISQAISLANYPSAEQSVGPLGAMRWQTYFANSGPTSTPM